MRATQLRQVAIHSCATHPNQILGGDRELVLGSAMFAALLAFSLASWWGFVGAGLFWLAAVAVLQRIGKADPLLRQVYFRHIRYRPFYPAHSGLHAATHRSPRAWR